ncbi:MAG: hypothetical protein L6R42_010626 [Xanthoria sp. 1 TBL-2021]|nr:MAG: hypothetical protein L6R42_010626 [Xanthoria sp. 1 TBL-2021]
MARSNESPMDFQWQQGYGPSGLDSPFLKGVANKMSAPDERSMSKGSFASFHSPQKPQSPSKSAFGPRPPVPPFTPSTKMTHQFRNPSFTTPQKSPELDFSSGAENQSSPANGDTEDTPEPTTRGQLGKNNGAMVQLQAERKQPALGIFGRYGMSGRGEIQRRPRNDVMARRIHKRKRRGAEQDVRIARPRLNEDSDWEGEDHERPSSSEGPKTTSLKVHQMGIIPAFFSYLETHPNLPHILSYYAQFLLNFFLVTVIIYMIYAFWSTIRSDVNEKSKEAAGEILVEMAMCARDYKDNKCDKPEARVPAMESICNSWEKCMQRDPTMVGRAKVSAHTFAEIINNFFQPISAKAMISLCVLFLGCLAVNNLTMYLFRHKTHPWQPPPQAAADYPQPPPSTPHAQRSSFAEDPNQHYTPYQNAMGMPRVDYREDSGAPKQSPTKRLGYVR